MSTQQTSVATAIERPPAFVRVEVETGRQMEIEFISSGTIPETGQPAYRTKSPGSARVKIFMRRALGLSARFLDGGPLFEITSMPSFEAAQKKQFETGNTLPIYYQPPRTTEPGYFTASMIGWRGIDQAETIQLAGQSEARLAYPAQRLIFVAAGGLIGRSGKRIMPVLDADGITFRFAEAVYGTLHVRYQAEYMDWSLEWSMPDAWYGKKSSVDPRFTNNERIARRLIKPDEMKPILVCVDAPPGAGGLPEDRKGHTVWIQLIERSFRVGQDEASMLAATLATVRHYQQAGIPVGQPCALVREATRSYLTYYGWPARQIPKDSVAYPRKKFLGRETEFSRLAHYALIYGGALSSTYTPTTPFVATPWYSPHVARPYTQDLSGDSTISLAANAPAPKDTPGWPLLPDVAVHWISDGVVISESTVVRRSVVDQTIRASLSRYCRYFAAYGTGLLEYQCYPGEPVGASQDYLTLKPAATPSASVRFEDLHLLFIARCRAYGIDTTGAEFITPFGIDGLNGKARYFAGVAIPATASEAERTQTINWNQNEGALTVAPAFFQLRPFTWTAQSTLPEYPMPMTVDGHAILRPAFTDETPGRFTPGTGQLVVDWDLAEAI